jgi:pimeloyl-ACP methyl ester carboxylesterase
MTKLEIEGASLQYVERGTGEPVVFVHGSASDWRTWLTQIDALGEGYRAIAYSRRYHWPNRPIVHGADYAMAQHVADLGAVLRSLGAAPAHLVGHSYGGFVALLLALRKPELVRSLILSEPPVITLFVSNQPKPAEMLRLLVTRPATAVAIAKLGATGIGPATAAARRGDMEEVMQRMGRAVLGPQFHARLSPERRDQVRANAIAAEFLGSGFPPLDERALRAMELPVLLVNGQRSPRVFHHLTDRLDELLPGAERIEIADASHLMHEDNAPAYNAALLAHLRRQFRRSSSLAAVEAA